MLNANILLQQLILIIQFPLTVLKARSHIALSAHFVV